MRRTIIIVVVLIALGVAGYYGFQRYSEQQAALALANLQTETIGRGPLVATVGATGTVRANQSAVLTWQTSGTVDQINIEIGDQVAAGDILMTLRQTSLAQNIILAQADLVNAQQTLEDLQQPATELALANARKAITDAEKAVDEATRRLNGLNSPAPQADIDQARSNLALAKDALERAQADFDPYANKPEDDLVRANFQSRLAQAQKNYDAAVRKLNSLLGTASTLDLSIAESNLEVALARLADAQETYEELQAGADANDILAAEARIAAAQATLNQAHIEALFPATVTDILVKPGDQVSPGKVAVQLADLSRLLVDVQVSEVDINRIIIGQSVVLSFDAILAQEYEGVIAQVAPVGEITQGVVNFKVTVELLEFDEQVKPGMTAAVNIVVSELEDVLLVPNRAVRFLEGKRVVYVLENGELIPVAIVLGSSSELYSEVSEGELKPGDQAVLNPPTVFETGGPPSFVR